MIRQNSLSSLFGRVGARVFAAILSILAASFWTGFVYADPLTSACLQEVSGGIQDNTTLDLAFTNFIAHANVVVVMVVYGNPANVGKITVSGLGGATFTAGYEPGIQNSIGLAFFYGTNVPFGQWNSFTITAPNTDNIAAIAEEWTDLSVGGVVTEDPGSQSTNTGTSSTVSISGSTTNPSDVVFNFFGFVGSGYASPPLGTFLSMGKSANLTPPFAAGGYRINIAAGPYSESYTLQKSVPWATAAVAVKSTYVNTRYSGTPLTDFAPGQLYLNKFPGLLYNQSNSPDPQHDADGQNIAKSLQPLGPDGNPDPTNGRIVVVGIGPSNWTEELCTGKEIDSVGFDGCDPNTFFDQAARFPTINPQMELVDCAQPGAFAVHWIDPQNTNWVTCLQRLSTHYQIDPKQVQVVLWMGGDEAPSCSLDTSEPGCNPWSGSCPASPDPTVDPDACY